MPDIESLTNQSQEVVVEDKSTDTKPEGTVAPTEPVAEKTTPEPEEEFDEIVYNKEVLKIPKSERKAMLQKGKHYDEVRAERDAIKGLIKTLGFDKVEDFDRAVQQEIANRKAAEIAEQMPGISDEAAQAIALRQADLDRREADTKKRETDALVITQREQYKDKPFFAELEPVIHDLIRDNPGTTMKVAYNYALGEKMENGEIDKLLDQKSAKVLENHQRQSKRGVESSDDAPIPAEKGVEFNAEEKAWAERQVRRGVYSSMTEAWEWLRGKK